MQSIMPRQNNIVKYVPAQEGAQTRIIRMIEAQKDPLEPPRFKLNQKVPPPPPSPPAPVMHSPPRKLTADEHKQWKIAPCVSSWKNPRGYTVPLDKRCALNEAGGGLPEAINPKFAQLAESLSIATRQHRLDLEERIKAEKLMAQKEKERNEERMRLLAQQAREERAAIQRGLGHRRDYDDEEDDSIDHDEIRERETMRNQIHRDRVRNINMKSSAPGKRVMSDRHESRDISEQIALGIAKPNTIDQDVHDQRLYNESQGLNSGFGEEDDYAVYDKAWKSKASFSTNYRPSENLVREAREETKISAPESNSDPLAPIQFEKEVEDVFNIESLLRNARNRVNAKATSSNSSSSKRHKGS